MWGSQSIASGMMGEQSHSSLDIWRATLSLGRKGLYVRKDILFCKLNQELGFVNYCEHFIQGIPNVDKTHESHSAPACAANEREGPNNYT